MDFIKYLRMIKLFKRNLLLIIPQLISFILLFYQIILLTFDYLSFPYNVKLDIIHNQNYLPAITLCTVSDNYFNATKLKSKFNLTSANYNDFMKAFDGSSECVCNSIECINCLVRLEQMG